MIRDVHPFGKEYGNVTIDFTDFRALKSIDPSREGAVPAFSVSRSQTN